MEPSRDGVGSSMATFGQALEHLGDGASSAQSKLAIN